MKRGHFVTTNLFYIFLLSALLLSAGCLAAEKAATKKKRDVSPRTRVQRKPLVETKVSHSIFLDLETDPEKTVLVAMQNSSGKDIDVTPLVKDALQQKGYTIKTSSSDSYYILQANILRVEMVHPDAVDFLDDVMYEGYGGDIEGVVDDVDLGAITSALFVDKANFSDLVASGYINLGTIVNYLPNMILNNGDSDSEIEGAEKGRYDRDNRMGNDITYTVILDLIIKERSDIPIEEEESIDTMKGFGDEGTNVTITKAKRFYRESYWRDYPTRIVSTAKNPNLQFDDAKELLTKELSKSLSGFFY